MTMINALAATETGPITTKTALRTLVKIPDSAVKIIPAVPSPSLVAATYVNVLPVGKPVTVHTGKATAVIERKSDGRITVK